MSGMWDNEEIAQAMCDVTDALDALRAVADAGIGVTNWQAERLRRNAERASSSLDRLIALSNPPIERPFITFYETLRRVDPPGCGCTDCLTGDSRRARDEEEYQAYEGGAS